MNDEDFDGSNDMDIVNNINIVNDNSSDNGMDFAEGMMLGSMFSGPSYLPYAYGPSYAWEVQPYQQLIADRVADRAVAEMRRMHQTPSEQEQQALLDSASGLNGLALLGAMATVSLAILAIVFATSTGGLGALLLIPALAVGGGSIMAHKKANKSLIQANSPELKACILKEKELERRQSQNRDRSTTVPSIGNGNVSYKANTTPYKQNTQQSRLSAPYDNKANSSIDAAARDKVADRQKRAETKATMNHAILERERASKTSSRPMRTR